MVNCLRFAVYLAHVRWKPRAAVSHRAAKATREDPPRGPENNLRCPPLSLPSPLLSSTLPATPPPVVGWSGVGGTVEAEVQ